MNLEPTRCFQRPKSLWATNTRCTHHLPSGDGANLLFDQGCQLPSSRIVQVANGRTEWCGRSVSQALAQHSLDVWHRRTITKIRQLRVPNDRIDLFLSLRKNLGVSNHSKNKVGNCRTSLERISTFWFHTGEELRNENEPYRCSRCTSNSSST